MAAVFALVFLFAFASSALFIMGISALSLSTAMAGAVFCGLSCGGFVGLLRMTKRWEGECV